MLYKSFVIVKELHVTKYETPFDATSTLFFSVRFLRKTFFKKDMEQECL
jgi:hypothetical protein